MKHSVLSLDWCQCLRNLLCESTSVSTESSKEVRCDFKHDSVKKDKLMTMTPYHVKP